MIPHPRYRLGILIGLVVFGGLGIAVGLELVTRDCPRSSFEPYVGTTPLRRVMRTPRHRFNAIWFPEDELPDTWDSIVVGSWMGCFNDEPHTEMRIRSNGQAFLEITGLGYADGPAEGTVFEHRLSRAELNRLQAIEPREPQAWRRKDGKHVFAIGPPTLTVWVERAGRSHKVYGGFYSKVPPTGVELITNLVRIRDLAPWEEVQR